MLLTFLMLSSYHCASAGDASTRPASLQVVVIAVSTVDDPAWPNNPALAAAIDSAAVEVQSFFGTYFPKAKCHVLRTPQETTKFAIRQLLDEFHTFGQQTLTLLFIISHASLIKNRDGTTDLLIAASDTKSSRLDESAISLQRHIFSEFTGLGPGSAVLLFLDTCHSGAAFSVPLADLRTAKVNIMAACNADQETYHAALTRALIRFWRRKHRESECVHLSDLADALSPVMQELAHVPGLTAPPPQCTVLDNLCMESLSEDHGLLLVEDVSASSTLHCVLTPMPDDPARRIRPFDVGVSRLTPVKLTRGSYALAMSTDDGDSEVDTLDVDKNGFRVVLWPQPTEPAVLGGLLDRAVEYAEGAGATLQDVTDLRERAYAAWIASGRTEQANALAAELENSGDSLWIAMRRVAFRPTERNHWSTGRQHTDKIAAAKRLKLCGDFAGAATMFDEVARESPLDFEHGSLAADAYSCSVAAGDTKKARKFGVEFGGGETSEVVKFEKATRKGDAASLKKLHDDNVIRAVEPK